MIQDIHSIQKTIQSTSTFINQLTKTGEFRNTNDAFVTLRSCLKALRDRIETGEAVHLGGQLPALLRGFYYEGWNYTKKPDSFRSKEDFLNSVSYHMHGHEDLNLEKLVPVTLKVILDSIDQGEASQIIHCLPKDIQNFMS